MPWTVHLIGIYRKAIPIQGTSVLLDTPEALDSWIAERRKRFPTAERVQEKKRKMEEAVARGQLAPEDMGLAGRKKRRHDHTTDGPIVRPDDRGKRSRGRGRGRGRGMGPGREAHVRRGEIGSVVNDQKPTAIGSVSLERLAQENHPGTSFESEEEGPPEEISSKTPLSSKDPSSPTVAEGPVLRIKAPSKPPPLQPRRPQRSSFLSKPALLRNVTIFLFSLSRLIYPGHFQVTPARNKDHCFQSVSSYSVPGSQQLSRRCRTPSWGCAPKNDRSCRE